MSSQGRVIDCLPPNPIAGGLRAASGGREAAAYQGGLQQGAGGGVQGGGLRPAQRRRKGQVPGPRHLQGQGGGVKRGERERERERERPAGKKGKQQQNKTKQQRRGCQRLPRIYVQKLKTNKNGRECQICHKDDIFGEGEPVRDRMLL